MPRQGRIDVVGCVYHIIGRGINRGIIYRNGDDKNEFVRRLDEAIKRTGTVCYGWAIMSNHFHLLLRRGRTSISDVMRKLLTGYAIYFNRRYKRRGYLFQNRYKSILCQEETYLLELVRYIHLNPVRAGLVEDVKRLRIYPWTGYATLMGKTKRGFQEVEDILGRFGRNRTEAAKALELYMIEGLSQGKRDDLVGGGLRRSAGGWSNVLMLKKSKEFWRGDDRILGEGTFVESILEAADQEYDRLEQNRRKGYSIKTLLHEIYKRYSFTISDLKKKGRSNTISEAKNVCACYAVRELGLRGKDISKVLGVSQAAVSKMIRKAETLELNKKVKLLS